jgi:hypothetical protein
MTFFVWTGIVARYGFSPQETPNDIIENKVTVTFTSDFSGNSHLK